MPKPHQVERLCRVRWRSWAVLVVTCSLAACASPPRPVSPTTVDVPTPPPTAIQAGPSTAAAPARRDHPTEPETPTSALRELIGLLSSGRYEDFIARAAAPEALAEMKRTGKYQVVLARFRGEWGRTLLERMRDAVKNTPTMSEDGTADFDNDYQTIPIILKRIDGHWHLVEP